MWLSPCIITCVLPWRPPVDKQSKKSKNHNCEAQCDRQAGWTVNFLRAPTPIHFFLTSAQSCTLLFVPALPCILFSIQPSSNPHARLYSASILSVSAFDLSCNIEANLTRQRKVTRTQRGSRRGCLCALRCTALVPKDCRLCDKEEGCVYDLKGVGRCSFKYICSCMVTMAILEKLFW